MSIYLEETPDGVDLGAVQLYNILPRPAVLRRFPVWGNSGRRYFTVKDGSLFIGAGSSLWKDMRCPPSRYLGEWFKVNGEESDVISADLAALGTFFHILFGEILTSYANGQNYVVSKTKIGNDLREYMVWNGMRLFDHERFTAILTRYCSSIFHWLMDFEVIVESLEYPVAYWKYKAATAIDAVVTCLPPDKIGNAKPVPDGERIRCTVNLKTRLKSQASYPDDKYQIGLEKAAYNNYLPSHPASHCAILTPVYTSASGSSFKFTFMDGYGEDEIAWDYNYWLGLKDPDLEMDRFLRPEKYIKAGYEESGEVMLDFSAKNKDFGKKTRGKSKESVQTIEDFCLSFFTENHI